MSRAMSLFDPPVDITDHYSTVYFIFKYTNLLLEEAAAARKPEQHKITNGYNALQLQEDISSLLLSETKEIVRYKTIKVHVRTTFKSGKFQVGKISLLILKESFIH